MKKETQNDKQKRLRQLGVYLTIPFVLSIPPVLGWLFGSWLDQKFGSSPVLMYIFIVLGFISGFRELFRLLKRFGDDA